MKTTKKKVVKAKPKTRVVKVKPKLKAKPKAKPKKPKYEYVLDVTYPLDRYPTGDDKVIAVLGDAFDSGMGFSSRDLTFYYASKEKALQARDKVRALNFPKLCVYVVEQNWDLDHYVEIK